MELKKQAGEPQPGTLIRLGVTYESLYKWENNSALFGRANAYAQQNDALRKKCKTFYNVYV